MSPAVYACALAARVIRDVTAPAHPEGEDVVAIWRCHRFVHDATRVSASVEGLRDRTLREALADGDEDRPGPY